jgi:hypothetical protein
MRVGRLSYVIRPFRSSFWNFCRAVELTCLDRNARLRGGRDPDDVTVREDIGCEATYDVCREGGSPIGSTELLQPRVSNRRIGNLPDFGKLPILYVFRCPFRSDSSNLELLPFFCKYFPNLPIVGAGILTSLSN